MRHDPSDLPSASLVDMPTPGRLSRLSVGTGPFNALAAVVLVAISSFVVLSSGSAPGFRTRAADATTASPSTVTIPHARLAFLDETSSTTTGAPTTTTAAAATTTTVAGPTRRHTAKTGTTHSSAAAAAPHHRTLVCSDFPTQPIAQGWFSMNRAGLANLDGDGDGIACEGLPGSPAPPSATTPTNTAPKPAAKILTKDQLLRPTTRLFGVHTPQAPLASELATFAADAGGKAPNQVMFFRTLSDPFPADAVANAWAAGMLPVITYEPIFKNSTTGQPKLADLTAGRYDDRFAAWATAAAAQKLPFVLRFAQEMNGDWYSWSDAKLGNRAGDFIGAWRHVHDLFDANGADQVIWNWSVNRVDNLWDKTLARVYPGDDYVDWVGISGYFRTDGPAPTFDTTFARTLAELKRVAPKKLVLLTEVGAGTGEANRVAWINDFFAKLLEHPEILGFTWFNDFKDGGDWRIEYSAATQAAFGAGVADSRYGRLVN